MRLATAVFSAALSSTTLQANPAAPTFMAGDWCAQQGEMRFEERWTAADDGRMFAVARIFQGQKLTGFEFLRVEPQADGYAYMAQPGGRPAVVFLATEQSDDRIVFSNPQHDPQRIEYFRDAQGLHALVSGPADAVEQAQSIHFKRGLCDVASAAPVAATQTMAQVLEASVPSDWRRPDPKRTLYLELQTGRVIIELAPDFAPQHVANILQLAASGYYDGLAILRVQDNFVAQWGDPNAEKESLRKPLTAGVRTLNAEFTRPDSRDLNFRALPDQDGYAAQTGFSAGFPAARDEGRAWLSHCYGSLGVGRDNDANSGGGTELYVVIGHAPRQLDRNITVVGRVLRGMELLSSLPRGTGPLGFYEKAEQRIPIKRVLIAADVAAAERSAIEVLRTDTASFSALVEARRNRRDEWYKHPAGHIDVCSVPLPVR